MTKLRRRLRSEIKNIENKDDFLYYYIEIKEIIEYKASI